MYQKFILIFKKPDLIKNLLTSIVVVLLCTILIFYTWGGILKLSFFLDDWPFMWLISTKPGLITNYLWLDDYFSGSLSPIGNAPVARSIPQYLITYLMFSKYGHNPYYYHLMSLISRLLVVITTFIVGWKLTRTRIVGIFAALYYSVVFFGSQSTWWYGTSITYFVAIFALLSIYFLSEGLEKNKIKPLCLSYISLFLGIVSFPIRLYTYFAYPFLSFIWGNLKIHKRIIFFVFTLIFLYFSVKLFFGQSIDSSQNRVSYGLQGYVINNLIKGDYYILLYPLNILSFSMFTRGIMASLINFESIQVFRNLWITNFRFWGITLSLIWVFFIEKISSLANSKKRLINLIVTFFGVLIIYLTDIGKDVINNKVYSDFEPNDLILFEGIISIFLIMVTVVAFFYLKNNAKYHRLVKTMSSLLIFIYAAFFVSWLNETKTPPYVPEVSRYATVSSVFGTIYLGTLLYFVINIIFEYNYFKVIPEIHKKIGTFVIFGMVLVQLMPVNIKISREYIKILQVTRSEKNISKVLDDVSKGFTFTIPPPLIVITLAPEWMWGEGFSVFQFGHSLAYHNGITDHNMIPVISYANTLKDDTRLAYCRRFSKAPMVYIFSVKLDDAFLVDKFESNCDQKSPI